VETKTRSISVKISLRLITAAAFVLAAASGFAQAKLSADDQKRFDSYFVSVEWAKANAGKVVFLDARSKADYDKGHLPGAVNLHWTQLSNVAVKQGEPGWSVILPAEQLAKILGDVGIDGKKPVVVYNDPLVGWGEEGRDLWELRVFGLTNTYALNGGLAAWKKAGGTVTTEAPKIVPVKLNQPEADWSYFASTDYLAQNLSTLKVFDVREKDEFAGKKNYGEKQNGRIPGAKNIWFKDLYHADGTVKTPEEIRAQVLAETGYKTDDLIVAYCTGGIRSGFATIVLRASGFEKARNYDASFSEWAGTNQTIEKP